MSEITLYEYAIPVFTRGLKTLDHILDRAEDFAKEKGLDVDAVFPGARLIEDQNPLVFQIQNATKAIKVNHDRLVGVDSEPFESKEKTFADLHARIQAARQLLETIDRGVANSRGDAVVDVVPGGGKPIQLSVRDAVLYHGIPNFIFHVTTAYSILRAQGVPLGKADYIRSFVGL